MAEMRTVATLRSKRAEILSAIAQYEMRAVQARADPWGVNACMAEFRASGEPGALTPYVDGRGLFAGGELTRSCYDRHASGPKTTKELAQYVMKAQRGFAAGGKVLARALASPMIHPFGLGPHSGAKSNPPSAGLGTAAGICSTM